MRKISLLAIAGLMLSITSCSLQLPEKVSAKTNANYNLFIGNIEKNLNFSTAIPGAYDYFPGSNGNLQQYILKVEVYSHDFSSDFSDPSIPDGQITLPGSPVTDKIALGFNPSAITSTISTVLGSGFGSSIQFDAVPVYLYFDYTDGITVSGKMNIYYGNSDEEDPNYLQRVSSSPAPLYILGSSTASATNISKCPVPTLPASTETVVTTNLADAGYSSNADLATIMNATVTGDNVCLCLDYNMQLGGTVTKSNGSVNAALSVYAIIVVPIRFNVSDEITMDLKSLAGITGDLLGRTSASGNNDISRYTEALRSVSFIYETQEKPFESSGEVMFHFDVNNDGNVSLTEKYSFSQGAVTLTADDLERIMTTVPYSPEMTVKIPAGTFSIKRTKNLKMNLGISLVTDGEIPLKQ